ncbi:MAG: hypothetical protein ACREF4_07155 [Gammaproteobacteria bacterium]
MRPPRESVECEIAGATAEADAVVVRYLTRDRLSREIEDRVMLAGADEIATIRGVGKLLRILRAGRVQPPRHPYALARSPESWAQLLERCRGSTVIARLARRVESALIVWTESGVVRFDGVVDFREDELGLRLRRGGGGAWLRIPRASLIRWSNDTREVPIVISVEVPARTS